MVSRPPRWEHDWRNRSSCRSMTNKAVRVTGALVVIRGPNGIYLDPADGLTDSSGQFTSNVSLGTIPGRYQLTASTSTKAGKTIDLKIEEIGLGFQEMLGSQLNDQYCARCHNQESTPGARLELRQSANQAAPLHRRRDAEQDDRCRPDRRSSRMAARR